MSQELPGCAQRCGSSRWSDSRSYSCSCCSADRHGPDRRSGRAFFAHGSTVVQESHTFVSMWWCTAKGRPPAWRAAAEPLLPCSITSGTALQHLLATGRCNTFAGEHRLALSDLCVEHHGAHRDLAARLAA